MMKKLLLIALASTLLASGANAEWKYVEKVDEMTGKPTAIILSEQHNGVGAVAYVTADCKGPKGEIIFAALFTDEQGEAIRLSNMTFKDGATKWSIAIDRYRMDDQIGPTTLNSLEFKNRIQVFAVATEARWKQLTPILAHLMLSGYGSLYMMPLAIYTKIRLIKAEFKTEFGDVVVTIDTTDAGVQRLYKSCFDSD